MAKHAISNTETKDLWAAWAEASGKPVAETMEVWTKHMGIPLVTVTAEDPAEGAEDLKLKLTQEWFLADGSESEGGPTWTIPLLATGSSETEMQTLDAKEGELTVAGIAKEGWVKLNAGQHVPFRVSYDATTYSRLRLAVRAQQLTIEDRVGLVSDSFALGRAGKKDMGDVLELVAEMTHEESYTVWAELEGQLRVLSPVLAAGYKNYAAFENFSRSLVRKIAAQVGWSPQPDDSHLIKMLRAVLIRIQAEFPSPEATEEAKKRFTAFLHDPDSDQLPAEYRAPVYKIVVKTGGEAEYNALYSIFKRAKTHPERLQVMQALGHSQHPQLKLRTLNWCLSEDVKLQDIMYPVMGVVDSGAAGIELAWQWFQDNFDELIKRAGTAMGIMQHLVSICGGKFVTSEKADEVEKYFQDHPVPSANRKISQMLENMRINAKWLQRMQDGKMGDDGFFVLIDMTMGDL